MCLDKTPGIQVNSKLGGYTFDNTYVCLLSMAPTPSSQFMYFNPKS